MILDDIKTGDTVVLIEKPNGCLSNFYNLTVGNNYTCLGFMGSNIVTTTDTPGETGSYNRWRVRKANSPSKDLNQA